MFTSAPNPAYALSIKQPWAALIVGGLKTIEVRRWSTRRRGLIYIHAARQSDDRPVAWGHVPPHLGELAQLRGGLIGSVDLTSCLTYPNKEAFVQDCPRHLNEPDWFEDPGLFGFAMEHPKIVPFFPYPGWFRFFPIKSNVPG